MCAQVPVLLAGLWILYTWGAFADGAGVSIVGGKEIKAHSKPWMASIQVKGKHICGGFLIQDQWVLTAAHCKGICQRLELASVLLGAHSLKNVKNTIPVGIESCKTPPTFDEKTKVDDIMLIKLKDKVKVKKEKVKPVKLPKSQKDVPAHTKCQVIGWGSTDPKGIKPTDVLQSVDVDILDRDYCNCLYKLYPVITEDMLCAGNKTALHDTCALDSGGPLECNKNVVGLVSGWEGCGDPKKPGVYTRLSKKHMSWINKIIKGQSNSTFEIND
ncbi:granzyme K-like isoform X2 [Clupea harengus]|uniref:Granzyme K-like isoform X2 n=1 Tax=Clupea harengus TaxID=7950 RepID=A0A8M1KMP2_CLUHA|nr:granzyme K-like isoform X2 [Clupea harengus]